MTKTQKIEVLQETTQWDWPNHTYVLLNGRLIAYKRHDHDHFTSCTAMTFNKQYRTFKKIQGLDLQDILMAVA
jgi:hypothetical protein